jgi:hypothetical protein
MSQDFCNCECCSEIYGDYGDIRTPSCETCAHTICENCWISGSDVDLEDNYELGEENCPFCTGSSTHPEQEAFVGGYLSGLKGGGLTHLTGPLVEPLMRYRYADLDFSFLKSMDDEAAHQLASQRGNLQTGGITDENIFEILEERDGEVIKGILAVDIAKQFIEDPQNMDLSEYRILEVEAAKTLSKYKQSDLGLDGLVELDEVSSKALSAYEGDLSFNGLTNITDSVSEALSSHKGGLFLNQVVEISDNAIEALSKVEKGSNSEMYPNGVLSLEALTHLSEQGAESLSKYKGTLGLEGVRELSDGAAMSFSRHQGDLLLHGIIGLSDKAADSLSTHQGALELNGLSELSDAAAASLSGNQGKLVLDGLTEISDTTAESLSKHQGELWLNGLVELSNAGAEALSKHQGTLWLWGLVEISDAVAKSLANNEGGLNLEGLTEISDTTAESLSKNQGELSLAGLTELSDTAAESLSKHQGELYFGPGLTEISDAAAESLSRHHGLLGLMGLTELSDAAARFLAKHNGDLLLQPKTDYNEGIALSPTGFELLAKLNGEICGTEPAEFLDASARYKDLERIGGPGAWCTDNNPEELTKIKKWTKKAAGLLPEFKGERLDFYSLTEITEAAAEALSTHVGYVGIENVGEISDAALESLSKLNGDLKLSIQELGVNGAKALSNHKHTLILEALQSLSTEAAEELIKHSTPLSVGSYCDDLPLEELSSHQGKLAVGLDHLHVDEAETLVKHQGGHLELGGVTDPEDDVFEILSRYKGDLILDGISELSDAAAVSLSSHRGRLGLQGLQQISAEAIEALEKHQGLIENQQPSDFLNEIYNPENDEEEED